MLTTGNCFEQFNSARIFDFDVVLFIEVSEKVQYFSMQQEVSILWFVLVNVNSSLGHEIACSRIDGTKIRSIKKLREIVNVFGRFVVGQVGQINIERYPSRS